MSAPQSVRAGNGEAIKRSRLPVLEIEPFQQRIVSGLEAGGRLSALFGLPTKQGKEIQLIAVIADPTAGNFELYATLVKGHYPSLTPSCPAAHLFEREIAEQWGLVPEGHPWLKPLRFHQPYASDKADWAALGSSSDTTGVMDFFKVEGEEIHEVAVGPVHAGIIEPGHFRFQCHGEEVLHLEISLGFQHRGVERMLVGGPTLRSIPVVETLAGDTTVGHMSAYCQGLEALCGCTPPARALVLRAVALELERIANHVGDLGALSGDVGYLSTLSFCGALRGDFLNLSAVLSGSRYSRGLLRPGGLGFDLDAAQVEGMLEQLEHAMRDVRGAVSLLWEAPSVLSRFEKTGTISAQQATELGLVGPAARACGLARDARFEFPSGLYTMAQIPVSTWDSGDVFARARIRWAEIEASAEFVRDQLLALPGGSVRAPCADARPDSLVVSVVEGWRGELCHVALTDADGHFERYKIIDPSFHNWMGLAMALRGEPISDFPVCNKSFNLSYCGHDL